MTYDDTKSPVLKYFCRLKYLFFSVSAPSRRVEVVEGSKAELPCRIISDLREEESPKLVLWFYNQSFTPFYT